jgi:4-amino-4-deoxy-L-arabinose transferase-like glycosyltransferase
VSLALLILVPVGLVLLGYGFDGLYGQDAYAYYDYARGPLRQSLQALQPPPPFFWPPGYPLLVATLAFIMGPGPQAGLLVSLVAGALVPVLTALLAREIWPAEKEGWLVPLLAGLLVACTGQLWQSSMVVMADTTGLSAATLGAWALARYGQGVDQNAGINLAWLLLATAAVAFAVLTRWAYALVAIPCTVYALTLLVRQRRTFALRHAAAAGLIALIVLSPLLAPVLRWFSAETVERHAFVGDLEVYTWHPWNGLQRTFETPDGTLRYRLPNGLYYALTPAHRFYFTPLLAPLLLPGLWTVLRRPFKRSTAALFLLLGWPAAVYIFHAGAPWQNLRFALAYLPPLAILAALGAATVARRLRVPHRWLMTGIIVAGLVWMGYGGRQLTHHFIQRKKANLATVRRVEAQLPPEGHLVTFGLTLTFRHYTPLRTSDLYELEPIDLADMIRSDALLYLLLDIGNATDQWHDLAPGINYRWLQGHANLLPIDVSPPYHLFQVTARDEAIRRRVQ